jgi:hypothetical protein
MRVEGAFWRPAHVSTRPPDKPGDGIARRLQAIRGHPAAQGLAASERRQLGRIIRDIRRTPPERQEFLVRHLEALFETREVLEGGANVPTNLDYYTSLMRASLESVWRKAAAQTPEQALLAWREELVAQVRFDVIPGHAPDFEILRSPGGALVRVDRHDPRDIVMQVRAHVRGPSEHVSMLLAFEDAIEKHLSVPGFTVDLVFVDAAADDAVVVALKPEAHTHQGNWVGDYQSIAHELMHELLGGAEADEYDRFHHVTNPRMRIALRLELFELAIKAPPQPADAYLGIMSNQYRPPLERHVCAAAQLPIDECLRARAGVSLRRPRPPPLSSAVALLGHPL